MDGETDKERISAGGTALQRSSSKSGVATLCQMFPFHPPAATALCGLARSNLARLRTGFVWALPVPGLILTCSGNHPMVVQ